MTWAQRLRRVFNIDIQTCLTCDGTMKVIACIEDPSVVKQILDHLMKERPTPNTRLPHPWSESRALPISLFTGYRNEMLRRET